ncbi:MAG: LysM peptidoglycan-binding domain-containing protein [Neisseriaceae bacterium]|nr:LysM peptidoglycan-binding domain-containing protein [Neisseriaceae bacterium]MBQ9259684.1 LysM peptidoglycan-binding domain-containing protein [Neisseriaceae bacterium]
MKKPIITLLCAMSLAISAPALALTVKKGAPERYTVKKGDTLWGISGMYLNQPGQWPELWGMNKSQIKNPHLIYPGQVLVLTYDAQGRPRLGIEGANTAGGRGQTIKLKPTAHDVSGGYSIETLPMGMIRSFMEHPNVIPVEETNAAPQLVAGPDKRLLYSVGDRVYADKAGESGRYLTYRVTGPVIDPDTKEVLGQEVVYSGEVATLMSRNGGPKVQQTALEAEKLGEGERYHQVNGLMKAPATVAKPFEITKIISEINQGDRLKYIPMGSHDRFNFAPHNPQVEVKARVIRVFNGVSEAGSNQTVILNRGERDGLDRGAIVSVYKNHKAVKRNEGGKTKYVVIPAEEIAQAMVYRTSERLSYAILLNAISEASIGDLAGNPGQDLEDLNFPPESVNNPGAGAIYKH